MRHRQKMGALFVCLLWAGEVFAQPLYTGSGGKGLSIAVPLPKGTLPEDDQWVLALIQGSLTSDFQKYSAMTVTDRQNLDRILAEQTLSASGYFSDDDYISIGHLTNVRNIVMGSLTAAPGNAYMLELAITNIETGERLASFGPRLCGMDEIQALGIIKEAAADLLSQIGVNLTAEGKQKLLAAGIFPAKTSPPQAGAASAGAAPAQSKEIAAEQALARGVTAERWGGLAEALTYYYDAAGFDPANSESLSRLSTLQSKIRTGNIGEHVRSDIQRRRAWVETLRDAEEYFALHPPYELVYDTTLYEMNINYENETLELWAGFILAGQSTGGWNTLYTLRDGLMKTGKAGDWGLAHWPLVPVGGGFLRSKRDYLELGSAAFVEYAVTASLLDGKGRMISRDTKTVTCYFQEQGQGFVFSGNRRYRSGQVPYFAFKIHADDITDEMTIQIESINRRPAASAGDSSTRIITKPEYDREFAAAKTAGKLTPEPDIVPIEFFGREGLYGGSLNMQLH